MSGLAGRKALWALAAGAAAIAVLVFWRRFFWEHAVLTGIAVAALVYSVLRSAERMRELGR